MTMTEGQPNGLPMPAPDYQGREYGAEKQLQQAAAAQPVIDETAAPTSPFAAALARAQMEDGPSNLLDDDESPETPITAGLPFGAGPGPEALGRRTRSRTAEMLGHLAATTGSPVAASLAAEAAARNL